MLKNYFKYILLFSFLVAIDQYIKYIFVNGFGVDGECISLVLAYNKGVAFSMFAFLADYLKYIQIAILLGGIIYLNLNKDILKTYLLPITLLFAGGISNIADRFMHEGVVDYVYWHCGFDFAIFNAADVIIDISIILILYISYKQEKLKKNI
jgi:signal peptidase II